MEFKKINDRRFQCRLDEEDLEDNNISLDDFLPNSNIALQMIEARDFESQVEIVARFLGELEKKSPLGLKDEISLAAML